jgi:hypothetical protein
LKALPAPYRREYGRVICGNPVSTPSRFIHFKRVVYSSGWSGEISQLYGVLIDLRKTGILAISGFRCKGNCLYPGEISSSLILSAEVRLGAKNALSAKIRPRRATCRLRIRDGSKIISGSTNVFLASI